MNNNNTCDREIGGVVKGWHRCGARAAYEIVKRGTHAVIVLGACHRHLEALQAAQGAWRIVRVRPLEAVSR